VKKPIMISRKHVGELFPGLNPKTLGKMTSLGTGPKAYKVGRIVFYKVADLEKWLTSEPR
jgi:hypothetical protein